MLAYHCSVGVRALEAKAMGRPSCRSAAPSPFCDASTWMTTGFRESKCGVLADHLLDSVKGFLVGVVPGEL